MVIGLLTIASIPTVIGVAEAISAQKQQNASLTKEQEKFNLAPLLRRKGKSVEAGLFLDLPDRPAEGHKFNGYYFKYPGEEGHRGMVSTIADDPPMLNWIYVDKDTHAVEFGARKDTVGHVIGPWGWSEDERFLTLEGEYDAFVAVREEADDGRWGVYWDPEGEIQETAGKRCQPVALCRKVQRGVESSFVKD
ncbi:hypothetical protein G7Z17_g4003 [Cylindrodendrum hubeiense]|uniref:Uncharacterized protein n=1 Tax=Cylindrodendrum hubeiense TaxID=595255 RepID=A0A9P5HGY7_9HYPO|nr:hypothetical protein G7Z17_g4003 [Cylindrodendrum hubeiense]